MSYEIDDIPKESNTIMAKNLNTILLTVTLGMLSFIAYSTYQNSVQLASITASTVSRQELDTKLAEINTKYAQINTELSSVNLRISSLQLDITKVEARMK